MTSETTLSVHVRIEQMLKRLLVRLSSPYLRARRLPIAGRIEHKEFISATSGTQRYVVYLPEAYDLGKDRYPILYHLHGVRVNRRGVALDVNHLAAQMERAIAAGIAAPMVIVAPINPNIDMWADSYDDETQPATMFRNDLIPHIDANFRTIQVASHRAICGFSMGGFGAAHLAASRPGFFGALIEFDGALHTWETLAANRPGIAENVFASERYFRRYSPPLVLAGADPPPRVMIVAGELTDYAGRFRDDLAEANIAASYVEANCGHDLFCLLDATGVDAFAFISVSHGAEPEVDRDDQSG